MWSVSRQCVFTSLSRKKNCIHVLNIKWVSEAIYRKQGLATLITVTSNHHHQCHGRSCLLLTHVAICFNFDTAEKKCRDKSKCKQHPFLPCINKKCIYLHQHWHPPRLYTEWQQKKCRTEKSVSIRNSCLDLVFFFTISICYWLTVKGAKAMPWCIHYSSKAQTCQELKTIIIFLAKGECTLIVFFIVAKRTNSKKDHQYLTKVIHFVVD